MNVQYMPGMFTHVIWVYPHEIYISISILRRRKQRLKEVKKLVKGHRASE